jgi:DNA recombination protein RmuC
MDLNSIVVVVSSLVVVFVVLFILPGLVAGRMRSDPAALDARFAALEKALSRAEEMLKGEISRNRTEQNSMSSEQRREMSALLEAMRTGLEGSVKASRDELSGTMANFISVQKGDLAGNEKKMEELKTALEASFRKMQEDNAAHMERIRATVDEKLQGTLKQRIDESFKLVNERLEVVHQGFGEMQALASGVGDLKRVLSGVKQRGILGEVQLGSLLREALVEGVQFETNVATKPGSRENVEFAVKLPNPEDGTVKWLPIDSKFPLADYERLLDAQDKADKTAVEKAGKDLEKRIRMCAEDICRKYLNPPATTDIGILFLPTEALFAEVVGRQSLVEDIHRDCRVMVAGPTTLWAILNNIRTGFRFFAIQERSSEVWNILNRIKTEWKHFTGALESAQNGLETAAKKLKTARTRSDKFTSSLNSVELPVEESVAPLLTADEDAVDEEETEPASDVTE